MANDPLGPGNEDREDGASIADRAEAGEHELELMEGEEPVRGDSQLSLNLGVIAERSARKVEEATISLQAAERPLGGLLGIDQEYDFVVRGRPRKVETVPVRKDGVTRAFKQRVHVDVLSVRRADAEEVVRELFAELLGRDAPAAGALLDELAEFLREPAAA